VRSFEKRLSHRRLDSEIDPKKTSSKPPAPKRLPAVTYKTLTKEKNSLTSEAEFVTQKVLF
jgi:hypothetical protein